MGHVTNVGFDDPQSPGDLQEEFLVRSGGKEPGIWVAGRGPLLNGLCESSEVGVGREAGRDDLEKDMVLKRSLICLI